jgi:hypothetical protein
MSEIMFQYENLNKYNYLLVVLKPYGLNALANHKASVKTFRYNP